MPKVRVAHLTPGRVRLRIDALREDASLAARISDEFGQVPAIQRVETRPVTGSVLVHYDPHADMMENALQLQRALSALGLDGLDITQLQRMSGQTVDEDTGDGSDSALARDIWSLFRSADARTRRRFRHTVDLRSLTPATFAALGVGSMLFRRPLTFPRWYEYLWYAFATFTAFHPFRRGRGADEPDGEAPEGMVPPASRNA
jgi:hypothetical protein